MCAFINIIILFYFLTTSHQVNVQIDGIIDLGPNWNYAYNINQKDPNHNGGDIDTTLKKKEKKIARDPTHVTKYVKKPVKINDIYTIQHRVKDDETINEFSKHVHRQGLQVFDSLKEKVTSHNVRKKLDFLARNYEVKFKEFVDDTKNQNIKTRLGVQRVIYNIMDTSNFILIRLINYLIGDMDRKGILGSNMAAAHVIKKEVDDEIKVENRHACTKFGICRAEKSFADFLAEFMTILIKCDDKKLKQASDAITEAAKNTDSPVFDSVNRKRFQKLLDKVDLVDAWSLRAGLIIGKNVMLFRNQPLHIQDALLENSNFVNRTLSFLDIINFLEKKFPGNEQNILEWNDFKSSLSDWSDGKRTDIEDIMQSGVKKMNKDLKGLTEEEFTELNRNLSILLK